MVKLAMNRSTVGRALALLVVTALAFYYVWQGWQMTDLSTKVTVARAERDGLVLQRHQLRLEVAKIWSLAEIERLAKEKLGMKKVQPKRLVLPPLTPTK